MWKHKRLDTFRITWKKFGNHHTNNWGWNRRWSRGKWYRRMFHKADRRYYKNYAKGYVDNPEIEPYIRDGGLAVWYSEIDWCGY